MCPQRATPATRWPPCSSSCNQRSITGPRTPASHSHQSTISEYFCPALTPPAHDIDPPATSMLINMSPTISTQQSLNPTPPTTPIAINHTATTQTPPSALTHVASSTQQTTLHADKCNDPWGNFWAIPTSSWIFRIVSKNTGTINPQNLDMQAMTHKLLHLGASVFAAQETNIHWDTLTTYQIYQQCKKWPRKSSWPQHPARNQQRSGTNRVEPCSCHFTPGQVALSTLDQTLSLVDGLTKNFWAKITNMLYSFQVTGSVTKNLMRHPILFLHNKFVSFKPKASPNPSREHFLYPTW